MKIDGRAKSPFAHLLTADAKAGKRRSVKAARVARPASPYAHLLQPQRPAALSAPVPETGDVAAVGRETGSEGFGTAAHMLASVQRARGETAGAKLTGRAAEMVTAYLTARGEK